jgi:hypothetical protein
MGSAARKCQQPIHIGTQLPQPSSEIRRFSTHGDGVGPPDRGNRRSRSGGQQTGRPGPAGNPNQPAAPPQANGPQGPRATGRPAGMITICHATKSHTNPYVEITISVNGLHGHGPAEDPHHHDARSRPRPQPTRRSRWSSARGHKAAPRRPGPMTPRARARSLPQARPAACRRQLSLRAP